MSQRTRRRILKQMGILTTGMVSISGCLTNRKAKISDLAIMNLHDSPHSITITVIRGSNEVYSRMFHVESSSNFGTEDNPAPIIRKPWMDKPGEYKIKCILDSSEDVIKREFPPSDQDGKCFSIVVQVSQDGILTLPYSTSDSCT